MDSLEKIKSLRKERGYTLKELAEKSGVPAGTVNKLFSGGIKSIKAETLIKLANALGADYSEILNGCERAVSKTDEKNEIKQKCAFDYGFARIAAYAPEVRVADVYFNVQKIIEKINRGRFGLSARAFGSCEKRIASHYESHRKFGNACSRRASS